MNKNTLQLKDIVRTIKKRIRLIIGVFSACVIGGSIITCAMTPTYEAETTLRVKQPIGLANSLLADGPVSVSGNNKELMSTYAEILKSRTVVQAVIDKTQQGKACIPAYNDFVKTITTEPVKETEILKIKVKAAKAEEAQAIANILVESFNERITTLARSEQSNVRQFIGERLQDSKKDLEKAETALENYKRDQRIAAPSEEIRAMVDKLSTLDKLAADNSVNLAAAKAKASSIEKQLGQESPDAVAESPLIQQYKSKLADLEVERVSLAQNYTDKHPKLQAVQAAIAEVKDKLDKEIEKVVKDSAASSNPVHQSLLQNKIQAEADIEVTAARQNVLKGLVSNGEQEITKLPAKEQGLTRVMRDVAVAQELYVMLAKRFEEARIGEVKQPTDVQIVDVAAKPDRPISPRLSFNIVVSAAIGLFAGMTVAFMRETMEKTIRTPDDVKHVLGLPVLASIPDFDGGSSNTLGHSIFSTLTNVLRKGGDRVG